MARDIRSVQAEAYRRLYKDKRWRGPQGARTIQLRDFPLCAMCEADGRITAATVCDHKDRESKLSEETFFTGPFQSLCKDHHDSTKQREERRAETGKLPVQGTGADGWPI